MGDPKLVTSVVWDGLLADWETVCPRLLSRLEESKSSEAVNKTNIGAKHLQNTRLSGQQEGLSLRTFTAKPSPPWRAPSSWSSLFTQAQTAIPFPSYLAVKYTSANRPRSVAFTALDPLTSDYMGCPWARLQSCFLILL